MAHFKCLQCGNHIELKEYNLKLKNSQLVSEQAVCCDTYMTKIRNFEGWGGIRKTKDGGVGGKQIINTLQNLKK